MYIFKFISVFSQTYNTDRMVSDSAGTATAFLCGEKAKRKHIGVSQHVPVGNCTAQNQPGMKLKSILKHSVDAGRYYQRMHLSK